MIKLLSASAAVALSLWFAGAAVAMPANALQGARSPPAIQLVRDESAGKWDICNRSRRPPAKITLSRLLRCTLHFSCGSF